MLDNLHVGMSLAGVGSLREDGCTFIQRHSRYTSIFMTTTPRYMKDKTVKDNKLCSTHPSCVSIYIYICVLSIDRIPLHKTVSTLSPLRSAIWNFINQFGQVDRIKYVFFTTSLQILILWCRATAKIPSFCEKKD